MSSKHKHLASAFDLFGQSYEVVMRNIKNFAILLFLPFLGSLKSVFRPPDSGNRFIHLNVFGGSAPAYGLISGVVVGLFALFIIATLVALILQAMIYGLQLEGAKGKTPSLMHLWQYGKKYWLRMLGLAIVVGMYLLVTSLFGLIVMFLLRNSLGILLGIVLIASAVLFVLRHYFLSPYAMVDKDLPIFAAMEESARISKNHSWEIFSVIGVMVLLTLTGIVPVLGSLIAFILGSLYSVAPALRYEELKRL